ncbi:anti-sigma regulatory factor (Ser/Thr protein kinase) [Actinomadura luteofluorescens]|uniref:Anti-sigma regulatory factor (Ser/Thr protein kinase) n=1 Tax=Actinomadura luteofluorescens TaxID=46163 RepID=A0A7Y9EFA9_9ACTN|nr:ATP-binding protein [Actinomadura luteofluorescens]NYD46547.1 anti-sigma regulatory factor (Ser/Thr protein kinase) [Actinomadura luteofluorescens]
MNDLEFIMSAHGIPEVRLTLLAVPSSVVLAREFVRYTLTNWGFGREVIDDASLVMSEIVSNAVAAAPGHRIRLGCALREGAPLLECWDPSPGLPVRCPPSPTSENGRGLAIVTALAKETGTRPSATGEGKVVWALMHA